MNIIQFFHGRIFGKLTALSITGTHVRICQGRKSPDYELPKTFQDYNFLNHTEEMAGWLRAILQEEKIQIRRCKIVLDSEQVYLQAVKLPVMTVEEQQNWVYWEGSQYVPYEPGTYQATLLFWPDSADFRIAQANRAVVAADLSAEWQEKEEAKLQDFLLVAIPLEKIEALRQVAGFLKAKLEEVTVVGPKQAVLPVNLLPATSRKEVIRKRVYLTATVLCLFISMFLAVRGGISWQRAKSAWLEADRQLKPFLSVKEAYAVSKKTDYRIRAYQQSLQHINRTGPVWYFALQTIGKTIPEGCWLDELQQKQTKCRQLEIKGCALSLTQVTEFLDNLEHSEFFSAVRLVESGTRQIQLTNRGDNSKKVVSFLLVADLTPEREEGMP